MSTEQAPSPAPSVGCPACLDPLRWKRHRARLGCSVIEARRGQVADLYRGGLSEREVAAQLGISPYTVHKDLEARGVAPRPQTAGLKAYKPTPEHLDALQEGHRRYRDDVERVKAARGLIDVDELLERLRHAGVPRSKPAIVGHVRDGLIEPEAGLGFDKPWLFTEASADALVRRLLSKYQDGRLTRFNPTTPKAARFRGGWYLARHKSNAEFGRVATVINKAGPKPTPLGQLVEDDIRRLRASGKSLRAIAIALRGDATVKQIRRVLDM